MSQQPKGQYASPVTADVVQSQKTSATAITSFVLGISSFVCVLFAGLPAIIFGVVSLVKISGSRGRLSGTGLAVAGIVTGAMGCIWTLIMIGLMLPAVQQVRQAARRTIAMNNVRQLDLANLNYESDHERFASNFDPRKPELGENLSWRVHLLPYLGLQNLHGQFKLDEPWDSPHNLRLVERMPEVFDHPNLLLPEGHTVFQIPVSSATSEVQAFATKGERGVTFSEIVDGSGNTFMVVEVNEAYAVPWTRPYDIELDFEDPFAQMGDGFPGGFVAGMADGSVHFVDDGLPKQQLIPLFTRDAGDAAPGPNSY